MPPIPPPKMVWSDVRVRVCTTINGRDGARVVQAKVCGPLALHPWVYGDGKSGSEWSVTSTPTGYSLCRLKTEEDAYKVADVLWRHFRGGLTETNPETLKSSFPPRLAEWLSRCKYRGEYLTYS